MKKLCRYAAHIAHALYRYCSTCHRDTHLAEQIPDRKHYTATSRLAAAENTTQANRLASDHAKHAMSLEHAVRIHHPGHNLTVRAYIRCRDILLRANKRRNLCNVLCGQTVQFSLAHLSRIADNAAFTATIRNVDDSALKGHPSRQRLHFVVVHRGMETHAALRRAAYGRMLDAKTFKHTNRAIIHDYRHGHLKLTLWIFKSCIFIFAVSEDCSRTVDNFEHVVIRIVLHFQFSPFLIWLE